MVAIAPNKLANEILGIKYKFIRIVQITIRKTDMESEQKNALLIR